MNNIYLNCIHNLITRLLLTKKNTYSYSIADDIYNVLFENDENNKRIFFDFFQNTSSFNKNEISYNCTNSILNRIDIVIKCLDVKTINEIVKYIDNNRTLVIDVNRYLTIGVKGNLPDDLFHVINRLNRYEKMTLNSLCVSCFRYSLNNTIYNLNCILGNIDDYYKDASKYKKNIIELFNFYIPVYEDFSNVDYTGVLNTKIDCSYIYFINDLLHAGLKGMNDSDEIYKKFILTHMYVYYMTYNYLINVGLGFFENDPDSEKMVYTIINGGTLNYKDIKYIFDSYKLCDGLSSIEDRIKIIREISKLDDGIYKLFTNIDIAKYEVKQKKKQAFGLH